VHFLELGVSVVICGRRENVLANTAAKLVGEIGGKVLFQGCYICDPENVEAPLDWLWHAGARRSWPATPPTVVDKETKAAAAAILERRIRLNPFCKVSCKWPKLGSDFRFKPLNTLDGMLYRDGLLSAQTKGQAKPHERQHG